MSASLALSTPVPVPAWLGAGLLLVLGGLGLARVRLGQGVLVVGGTLLGVLRGCANAGEVQSSDQALLTAAGLTTGIFTISCVLSGLALFAEQYRASIALRVAASWIVAVGLLMLGWELRPGT